MFFWIISYFSTVVQKSFFFWKLVINFYREGCIQTTTGYVFSVILDEFVMSIERKEEEALRDIQILKESQTENEEKQQ